MRKGKKERATELLMDLSRKQKSRTREGRARPGKEEQDEGRKSRTREGRAGRGKVKRMSKNEKDVRREEKERARRRGEVRGR